MTHSIAHDISAQSFQTLVAGQACYLDYELADGVMTITHTVVPEAVAGQGIAGELVRAALDAARLAHWKVVPVCSYAQAWLDRHEDYQALLA